MQSQERADRDGRWMTWSRTSPRRRISCRQSYLPSLPPPTRCSQAVEEGGDVNQDQGMASGLLHLSPGVAPPYSGHGGSQRPER
ncbi:hypothetical protein E2562_004708 [Oryza meyeriana var. granulata]|uniref:Uncharacterized protein n=1 Tax=Oryza meyeriana var. granulata TaxID=110450 RepID=A0A6G1DDZ1_9ORYZ|nr:hypothetical protein E2562_004708 [Oryza meyeriana var. granulata]